MKDRLIELQSEAWIEWQRSTTDVDFVEYYADHLLANGVIVPPVKVGTRVYAIALGKIYEWDIASYVLDNEGLSYINVAYMSGHRLCRNTYPIKDIGKSVFLSREDAEQALKGGE
jgi:hypothetical protein